MILKVIAIQAGLSMGNWAAMGSYGQLWAATGSYGRIRSPTAPPLAWIASFANQPGQLAYTPSTGTPGTTDLRVEEDALDYVAVKTLALDPDGKTTSTITTRYGRGE